MYYLFDHSLLEGTHSVRHPNENTFLVTKSNIVISLRDYYYYY